MELKPTTNGPAFLKLGLFGHTGCGKTYTAALVLSRFIAEYGLDCHLAMFDTEGGAEYVAPMVKEITGRELLAVHSQSFPDLLEFAALCKEEGHVALCDSITHPWRALVEDYMTAKRSRIAGAGGNTETARMALHDWAPVKELWGKFSHHLRYGPVHWCICGREGDVWAEREDEEGQVQLYKAGVKMKTEGEMGYEPSLLVRMELIQNPPKMVHRAFVVKDRFAVLTGASGDDPGMEFFRPHLDRLAIGGKAVVPCEEAAPAFVPGSGPNWETIKARREAALGEIRDDLVSAYPGQTAAEKKAKIAALRAGFGCGWETLEKDPEREWTEEALRAGRQEMLKQIEEEKANA